MRSLGIRGEQERLQQEDIDEYAKLFKQLLSEAHVRALTALFGWSLPDPLLANELGCCPV
jgi:hypothetical protein